MIRYTNQQPAAVDVTFHIGSGSGLAALATNATAWTLAADSLDAANPPSQPDLISPKRSAVDLSKPLTIAASSYVVIVVGPSAAGPYGAGRDAYVTATASYTKPLYVE